MFSRSLTTSRFPFLALIALGSLLAACGVSTEQHNAVLDELQATQESLADCQGSNSSLEQRVAFYETANSECEAQLADLRSHFAATSTESQRRDAIYDQLVGRLQDMIDAGQLEVRVEDGRIVLVLPNDVLFESGSAELGDAGRATLTNVAAALSSLTDQRFQVEGHTDNVPISNDRFASNWELSTARAVSVVNLLIEQGVAPENLSAAGFGEFSPHSPNDTDENRAQNRRIKIVLLPDLGNLPEMRTNGS